MIEQLAIILTTLGMLAFNSANRILIGCLIGLIGVPFWIYAAAPDQWGVIAAVSVQAIVYFVAIALRLRAKRMVK